MSVSPTCTISERKLYRAFSSWNNFPRMATSCIKRCVPLNANAKEISPRSLLFKRASSAIHAYKNTLSLQFSIEARPAHRRAVRIRRSNLLGDLVRRRAEDFENASRTLAEESGEGNENGTRGPLCEYKNSSRQNSPFCSEFPRGAKRSPPLVEKPLLQSLKRTHRNNSKHRELFLVHFPQEILLHRRQTPQPRSLHKSCQPQMQLHFFAVSARFQYAICVIRLSVHPW